MTRLRRVLITIFMVWFGAMVWLATMLEAPAPPDDAPSPPPLHVDTKASAQLVADALATAASDGIGGAEELGAAAASTTAGSSEGDSEAPAAAAMTVGGDGNGTSIVASARSRVAAEAGSMHDDNSDGIAEEVGPEHAALQGAAVQLLTAQSECGIQTFTNRHTARSKNLFDGDVGGASLAGSRHGAERAFDADSATSYHSACGLPAAPWWISYRFPSPTTVSTLRLTSDAP